MEVWIGKSGFLISWAIRRAISRHAATRSAATSCSLECFRSAVISLNALTSSPSSSRLRTGSRCSRSPWATASAPAAISCRGRLIRRPTTSPSTSERTRPKATSAPAATLISISWCRRASSEIARVTLTRSAPEAPESVTVVLGKRLYWPQDDPPASWRPLASWIRILVSCPRRCRSRPRSAGPTVTPPITTTWTLLPRSAERATRRVCRVSRVWGLRPSRTRSLRSTASPRCPRHQRSSSRLRSPCRPGKCPEARILPPGLITVSTSKPRSFITCGVASSRRR